MKEYKRYSFTGHVIRLTDKDYDRFWQTFMPQATEGEFLREISRIDDWMFEAGPTMKKKWFFVLTGILAKKVEPFNPE